MCVTEGMVTTMAQTNSDLIPDLSHLTLEERQIIESVMMRQKQEEERELEIMRRKQDEVHLLEQSIRQRSEQQKKAGVELDATCHICLKTKFADGVGHMCNYCNIRCCARCGGKVTLRSNKVIWVCILCRKKQELLSKTGQWINKGMGSTPQGDAIMRKIEADMMFEDKRPKLERAHSASEKENQPMLTRNNSGLRRQYSQQDTPPYRIPSSDSGVDMRHSTSRSRDEELRYYRGELEGLMRQQYSGSSTSQQYRHDSLSSDQSSSHKKRDRRTGGGQTGVQVKPPGAGPAMSQSQLIQQGSFSSSEDELRSTSEGTSCEEHDSEKESKRRKKTVRFDGNHNQNHINHQSSTGKDSGIDTFTSSEDSNSAQHPLSWKPSADGKYMIGHMILRKSGDRYPSASSTLGIKVIGGKLLEDGGRGAIIEKVKKGSPADLEGHLLAGDQVIEWNGRSMRGKSFQDVEDIIAESRQEPQVELIVSRRIQPKYAPTLSKDVYERVRDKPSVLVTSPGSPDVHSGRPGRHAAPPHPAVAITNNSVGGRIQVKFYLDSGTLRLVVTLMCAAGLVPRSNGQPRCPYAKIYLLPDRSEKSKRRTKTLANTNDPKWSQSFFYPGIRRSDLKLRTIEITVWDYTRYGVNDFLGEVLIELSSSLCNDEPEWFYLTKHGSSDDYLDYRSLTPTDHLSPPSTISRLSDSDTSLDNDDNRRIADGASISSLGSSNSPPPDLDYVSEKRKSRRDTSPPEHKRMHPHPHPMSMDPSGSRGAPSQGRSHSAASASHSPRSRSKSPPHRSLSPPYRVHEPPGVVLPTYAYIPRFHSRSATATPVSSPKKHRQLPQIPAIKDQALKERVAQDLEERSKYMNQKMRQAMYPRSTGGYLSGGSSRRQWSGVSDGDLNIYPRRCFSPPPHDSDMDSVVSSAFSTQSERPRGSSHYSMPKDLDASSYLDILLVDPSTDLKSKSTPELNADSPTDFNFSTPKTTSYSSTQSKFCRSCSSSKGDLKSKLNIVKTKPFDLIEGQLDSRCTICNCDLSAKVGEILSRNIIYKESDGIVLGNDGILISSGKHTDSMRGIESHVDEDSVLSRARNREVVATKSLDLAVRENEPDGSDDPVVKIGKKSHSFERDYNRVVKLNQEPSEKDDATRNTTRLKSEISKQSSPGKLKFPNQLDSSTDVSKEKKTRLGVTDQTVDMTDENSRYVEGSEGSTDIGSSDENRRSDRLHDANIQDRVVEAFSRNPVDALHPRHVSQLKKPVLTATGFPSIEEYPSHECSPEQTRADHFVNNLSFDSTSYMDGEPTDRDTSFSRTVPPSSNSYSFDHTNSSKFATTNVSHSFDRPSRSVVSSSVDVVNPSAPVSADFACSDYGHSSGSNASSVQHNQHHSDSGGKRGTFSRSLSNADVPSDDNGKSVDNTSLRSSDTQLHQSSSLDHHGGGSDSRRRGGKGSSGSGIKHSNSGTSDRSGNSSDRDHRETRSDRERGERGERSSNLGKKSSSTSQLSATGRRRRLGFGAKGKSSFTVHRSEEILPGGVPATSKPLVKQASSISSDGDNPQGDPDSWTPTLRGSDSGQLSEFIEGLGPGQVVGRQVLGLPSKGEVQLSLNNVKGCLVVEVIRAKNLQPKPDSKTLPAPYVKLYLVTGKKCIAKAKTPIARRTLEPLYQKSLTFREPYQNCVLQVTVWGDYGRLEGKKVFMGVAQIMLDQLDLSKMEIGWYKLFGTSALVNPAGLNLSRRSSLASLDSIKL